MLINECKVWDKTPPGRRPGATFGAELRVVGCAKPACKPGSVQGKTCGSHSSRRTVARPLQRPTREQREPRCRSPIRSCSGWGLPTPGVAAGAVRSYRTISPLPDPARDARPCGRGVRQAIGGVLSVALSVASRRPAVSRHPALWSPDFPLLPFDSSDCPASFARLRLYGGFDRKVRAPFRWSPDFGSGRRATKSRALTWLAAKLACAARPAKPALSSPVFRQQRPPGQLRTFEIVRGLRAESPGASFVGARTLAPAAARRSRAP